MKAPMTIGVDLGGTNCRLGLVDGSGKLLELIAFRTQIEQGLLPLVDRIVSAAMELAELAQQRGDEVEAMGIGVPGLIGKDGVVSSSPNLEPLNQVPFRQILRTRLGLPVTMVNDANAYAWAETVQGAGQAMRSFVCFTLGTGVGGGLILERKLWTGTTGMAGEIGHMKVAGATRRCGCGGRGCLETLCGASGILQTAEDLVAKGLPCLPEKPAELSVERLFEAAQEGHPLALATFEKAGEALGQVLAQIATLLDIEGAVIGGGVSPALPFMEAALQRVFAEEAFGHQGDALKLLPARLGGDAGILGAAHLAAFS